MAKKSIQTILFDSTKSLGTYVYYKTVDKNGAIQDITNVCCFSALTYNAVSHFSKIIVYHKLDDIPYSKTVISNWIKDLNELGFPIELVFDASKAYFHLDLKHFSKKFLFNSTLQLTRCLYEDQIAYVPEIYFNLLKEGETDKFMALQKAHFMLHDYKESCMYNSNHTITCNKAGNGISREVFQQRLEKSNRSEEHT